MRLTITRTLALLALHPALRIAFVICTKLHTKAVNGRVGTKLHALHVHVSIWSSELQIERCNHLPPNTCVLNKKLLTALFK